MEELASSFDSIIDSVRQGKTGYSVKNIAENLKENETPYKGPLLEPALKNLMIEDGFVQFAFVKSDVENLYNILDVEDTFSHNLPFLYCLGNPWKSKYDVTDGWKNSLKKNDWSTSNIKNLFMLSEKISLCMNSAPTRIFLPVITSLLYLYFNFEDFYDTSLTFPFITPNIENHQYRENYQLSSDKQKANQAADRLALLSCILHGEPQHSAIAQDCDSEDLSKKNASTPNLNKGKHVLIKDFLSAVLFTTLLFEYDSAVPPFSPLTQLQSPHNWSKQRIERAKENVFVFEQCTSNLAQALWGEYSNEEFEDGSFLKKWYSLLCTIITEGVEPGSKNKYQFKKSTIFFDFFSVRRVQYKESLHFLEGEALAFSHSRMIELFDKYPKIMAQSGYEKPESVSDIFHQYMCLEEITP